MSNRSKSMAGSTEFSPRRKLARERQPAIVLVMVALLATSVVVCITLIAPVVWDVLTEAAQRPTPTYQQCGAVRDDTARLACYDGVFRRDSLHSAKDMHRMGFRDILTVQPNTPQ